MAIFSYVVARDFGFAPNPFFGWCTLATCKPTVRKGAQVDDWVVGLGSAQYGLTGRIVFALRVEETPTFSDYWSDARFILKRPDLCASYKYAFGDNIYRRSASGRWLQEASHHSMRSGRQNLANTSHDTKTDRVLASRTFYYWGADAIKLPGRFADLLIVRGNRHVKDGQLQARFSSWLLALPRAGLLGAPMEFENLVDRG